MSLYLENISQEMAANSNDIVSTLQAVGIVKYWKNKHIILKRQVGNLGVVFDGALTWEAHVAELSRRCMGVLIGLSHARHCLPDGILKTIVTALVISRVQYCLTVYGNDSGL
ncbi:Histone acetyltransferase KAT7 [Amphibalanus amphitrite]|uniref:Histone acetyltransferase KAT7 n=1 Tax=Amphibalanus amphitrite TaxID=1232801 RepID=A0A6A4X4F9_AMPAM|nr:Histone acetyltransferase KAT7 [Amphibalanus amphitrite]